VNQSYITKDFEAQKNWKASGYTLLICTLLAIVLLFVTWTEPSLPIPPVEDGIEVNLGNNDQGLGTDQPFLPGKPSAQDQEKYTVPKQAPVEKTAYKDVETNDKEEDAPAIKKPPVTKPDATKIPDKEIAKNKPVKVIQPVTHPTPAPPKPKAVFHGVNGTGKGGNDADDYKPGANEGIAGGKGDQDQPGGDPNAKNYTGGGRGNSGVSISKGLQGRSFKALPSFTDDFNDNAKVAVDIHVDASGNVLSADYQPRGSTTSDASMKEIALRKAKQIKFNATSDESVGTLVFNFHIKN
jgi:outer membrane biosynthesis protein TonB